MFWIFQCLKLFCKEILLIYHIVIFHWKIAFCHCFNYLNTTGDIKQLDFHKKFRHRVFPDLHALRTPEWRKKSLLESCLCLCLCVRMWNLLIITSPKRKMIEQPNLIFITGSEICGIGNESGSAHLKKDWNDFCEIQT